MRGFHFVGLLLVQKNPRLHGDKMCLRGYQKPFDFYLIVEVRRKARPTSLISFSL